MRTKSKTKVQPAAAPAAAAPSAAPERMVRTMAFQQRFLADTSPMILVEKSRQIGLSEYCALKAVRECSQEGARVDWWIVSRDETQAKLFLDDCKKWAELYKVGAEDLGTELISEANVYWLRFANGRKIHCLSSNPNALAGKRGTVVLDEFALHENQELLLQVARPCQQWGGQLIVISTHRGAATLFHQLIRGITQGGNPMGWSHHRITLHDAVEAGLVERIVAKTGRPVTREEFLKAKERECVTHAAWLQEYCCQPQASEGQFLPYEHILNCETADILRPDLGALPEDLYLGCDVARRQDAHVYLCLGDGRNGTYTVRSMRVMTPEERTWAARDAALDGYLRLPNLRKACIDRTGIGDKFVEDARARNGWRVQGIDFTAAAKEDMAMRLAQYMEQGRLRIPHDDRLRRHLCAVTRGYTKTGQLTLGADHSADGHADMFWALALALHAATARPGEGAWDAESASRIVVGAPGAGTHRTANFVPRRLN